MSEIFFTSVATQNFEMHRRRDERSKTKRTLPQMLSDDVELRNDIARAAMGILIFPPFLLNKHKHTHAEWDNVSRSMAMGVCL